MATAYYRHEGRWVDYTPASVAVNAGDVVVLGDFVGIASNDIAVGVQGALHIEGAYDVPLLSGDVPKIGDTMYWDVSALAATVHSAYSSAVMGLCILLSPGGDPTMVRVKLEPALAGAGAYGP